MKVLDVLNGAPWAIQQDKLLEIQSIYATHLRGESVDLAAVEKRLGRPLDNAPKSYTVTDGVAIIAVDGVLAKRMNLFSQISGGTSTQMLARDLQDAQADASVHSIILAIDSPGGTVDGTQTFADLVAACSKPIVSLASGCMCSAAYWIGCAANSVYVVDSTTLVGSIGVVATHMDVSKAEAAKGVKTTEIYAGAYKRIDSTYEPLTEAGRQSIQDRVDYTYALFVDAVAKARGTTAETVLKNMADGRVFMGQQAVDAGLVDGITTLDALVAQLNANRTPAHASQVAAKPATKSYGAPKASTPASTQPTAGASAMTPEELQAQHPAIAAHFQALGATAERERIAGIEAQALPGHEKLIAAMKADGNKTAADTALAIVAAEKSSQAAHASAQASEAPAPLPAASAPATEASDKPKTKAEIDTQAKAHMAAHPGVSYIAAVKHIQAQA